MTICAAVLTLDFRLIFDVCMLIMTGTATTFAYIKFIRQSVDKNDLNKLETRLTDEDKRIEGKVDRIEDHLREDISALKEGQMSIIKILMEIRNTK